MGEGAVLSLSLSCSLTKAEGGFECSLACKEPTKLVSYSTNWFVNRFLTLANWFGLSNGARLEPSMKSRCCLMVTDGPARMEWKLRV